MNFKSQNQETARAIGWYGFLLHFLALYCFIVSFRAPLYAFSGMRIALSEGGAAVFQTFSSRTIGHKRFVGMIWSEEVVPKILYAWNFINLKISIDCTHYFRGRKLFLQAFIVRLLIIYTKNITSWTAIILCYVRLGMVTIYFWWMPLGGKLHFFF